MGDYSSVNSTKNVYNSIAEHFSNTRYSVWGSIKDFTDTIPDYSLVADVGCGMEEYFEKVNSIHNWF